VDSPDWPQSRAAILRGSLGNARSRLDDGARHRVCACFLKANFALRLLIFCALSSSVQRLPEIAIGIAGSVRHFQHVQLALGLAEPLAEILQIGSVQHLHPEQIGGPFTHSTSQIDWTRLVSAQAS
jgi:hypothetical protein